MLRPVLSCSLRLRELVSDGELAKPLARLAARSARPSWTLAAIAMLVAASIVVTFRFAFG